MIVYIDVLIFTNIIINYCILSLTQKFLNIEAKTFKIILAALIGAVFSLTVFIDKLAYLISLLIKLICVAIMCFIGFGIKKPIVYIKCIFLSFAFSILFCGVIMLIQNTTNVENIAVINDNIYFCIDPLTLITLSIIIYTIIIIAQRIFSSNFANTLVNLKFKIGDAEYSCIAKIDTACSVCEPFTGSPVIIVEVSLIKDINNFNRIIPYKALGANGILKGVKANKITIDKKVIDKDVYIAVFNGSIDPQFQAIINHKIVR